MAGASGWFPGSLAEALARSACVSPDPLRRWSADGVMATFDAFRLWRRRHQASDHARLAFADSCAALTAVSTAFDRWLDAAIGDQEEVGAKAAGGWDELAPKALRRRKTPNRSRPPRAAKTPPTKQVELTPVNSPASPAVGAAHSSPLTALRRVEDEIMHARADAEADAQMEAAVRRAQHILAAEACQRAALQQQKQQPLYPSPRGGENTSSPALTPGSQHTFVRYSSPTPAPALQRARRRSPPDRLQAATRTGTTATAHAAMPTPFRPHERAGAPVQPVRDFQDVPASTAALRAHPPSCARDAWPRRTPETELTRDQPYQTWQRALRRNKAANCTARANDWAARSAWLTHTRITTPSKLVPWHVDDGTLSYRRMAESIEEVSSRARMTELTHPGDDHLGRIVAGWPSFIERRSAALAQLGMEVAKT